MAKKTSMRKPIRVLKKKAAPKAPSKKKKAAAESAVPEILFIARNHFLVPMHEVLSQEQVETLFTTYNVSPQNLPIILVGDASLVGLDAKMGDIIRITRPSPTAGTAVYYRRVAYE